MADRGGTPGRLRGRRGQERRERWLIAHPLCQRCEKQRKARLADVVDHVIALANGGADDESNLQSLCDPCHIEKTAEDLNYRPPMQRDAAGWLVRNK